VHISAVHQIDQRHIVTHNNNHSPLSNIFLKFIPITRLYEFQMNSEKIYVLDERGEVVWSIEDSKGGADMSDNCYTLLGSGNSVTLLSPSGEVVQRETLNGEAAYVKISPNVGTSWR